MPVTPTYPGVYIEEVPSPVRAIPGVSTSRTAFVGRALRGPVDQPISVRNFGDFQRIFGGLWNASSLSFAVRQFFQNGGADALVVRIAKDANTAKVALAAPKGAAAGKDAGAGGMTLVAANPGAWGNNLRVAIENAPAAPDEPVDPSKPPIFNLKVDELGPDGKPVGTETHLNLTIDEDSPRFVTNVLESQSKLLRVDGAAGLVGPIKAAALADGTDGRILKSTDYVDNPGAKKGLFALEHTDLFNILCLPPPTLGGDHDPSLWAAANQYCIQRRAFLIVDAPTAWNDVSKAKAGMAGPFGGIRSNNSAFYFPRLKMANALLDNQVGDFAPCGAVAGVLARTDAQRGIWKAPAGQEASINGARGISVPLTDMENGDLNPIGLNCFRSFPATGTVVWGARTSKGADQLASQWKYIPVRRTALHIEESLYRGTQWVVFEPNDEPLWAQIRLNVGAFMHGLFRKGAFQGGSPKDAYFVKCDAETTTQDDIDLGIVNILVGFAPLKPAEFVIIKISQITNKDQ